jgi:molybdopterin molybdotransferase
VSSYVTAFLFLLPLLRALGGASCPLPRPVAASLASALPPGGSRTEFVRARREGEALIALNQQDSSALAALASADALIERPVDAAPASIGELVTAYWLENGGVA